MRSLKKMEFLAQSTCENKFWSNTLHISSNKSTSHWLYVWLCRSPYKEFCHSRSSIACTKSLIRGETLLEGGALPLGKTVSNWNVLGLSEWGDVVVELAVPHSLFSGAMIIEFCVPGTPTICNASCWLDVCWGTALGLTWPRATAIGLGEESGEDVSEDTWGIWISCLMWMLAKGEVPGWLLYMPPSPNDPRKDWAASCLWRIIWSFRARSLLYIGPNLFLPPLILSARTAKIKKKLLLKTWFKIEFYEK